MFAPLPQHTIPAGTAIDKENYQPDFSFGLPDKEDCNKGLCKSRDRFENLLKHGKGHDAVQVWCDYVSWAQQHSPHDEAAILERACQALVQDLRYRDEVRHLRLWVLRAKLSEHPFEILASLDERGLFAQHALLYEAWATELERQRRFQDAERVFQLGLERRAQPRSRLQSHSDGFQKRMLKRTAREAKRLRMDPALAAASQKPASVHPEHLPGGGSQQSRLVEQRHASEARPTEERTMDNVQQLIRGLHAPKSAGSAVFDDPTYTQAKPEHTMDNVQQLIRDLLPSRSAGTSPASVATLGSAIFDDPTYTQEVMSREVLGLLAGNVKRTPSRSRGTSLSSRASLAPRAPPEAAAEQCPALCVQKSAAPALLSSDGSDASLPTPLRKKLLDEESAENGHSMRSTASDAGQLFSAARDASAQRSEAEARRAAVPGRSSLRRPSVAADDAENKSVRAELLMTAPPTHLLAASPQISSCCAQGSLDESSVEFDFESANRQFELQRSQCAATAGAAPLEADAGLDMYEDTCFKIHGTEASPDEPRQQCFSGFGSQSSGAAPWGNPPFGFAG